MTRRAVPLIAGLAAALLVGAPAVADDVFWMSPSGGSFVQGSNWSTGAMPGAAESAVFNLSSAYSVWASKIMSISALRITSGDVSLLLTGGELRLLEPGSSVFEHSLRIGASGGAAMLRVTDGALRAGSSYLALDWNESASAVLSGSGAVWSNVGELFVGFAGEASVLIAQGGVITAQTATIGGSFSGLGELLVSDPGSSLSASGRVVVASAGEGALRVQNGAVVASPYVDVAAMSDGLGLLEVRGSGSAAFATQSLTVGGSPFSFKGGSGEVRVEAGGSISAGELLIADTPDGSGLVSVEGVGSVLVATKAVVGPELSPLVSPSARLRVGGDAIAQIGQLAVTAHGRIEGNGTLQGSVESRGVVAPGTDSPGTLSVQGDYVQVGAPTYYEATSELEIRLAGPPGSPGAGRLVVSGSASLGGRLRVLVGPGFQPQVGQLFEVLQSTVIDGAFQQVILPMQIGVWRMRYAASATSVFVEVIPGGIPGDTNGDCAVNFADLNAVLSFFGQAGFGLPADVNGDGLVSFQDLNLVLSYFGQTC